VPGDEHWAAGFNYPGINRGVASLVFGPDGSLYAGGEFTAAGAVAASRIARWDGAQWHPLGSGMAGGDYPSVWDLAFGPDGSLYAGGNFTTAGGVAANFIARWDGSQWQPLGSGMAGGGYPYVRVLALGPDGSLYAGGSFQTAGGVTVNGIARWDGATSSWHPLGSGMGGDYTNVYALAVGPDGSLYAGGDFSSAGGVAANSIARWDGSQWHPLGSGMGGEDYPSVSALAFGPDGSLYAGGGFLTAGGVAANSIARWDGATSSWHPLGNGMAGGGYPYVHVLALGPDGSLYAGGAFTTAGGVAADFIARWDGAQWHPLGSGMNSTVGTLAFGSDGSLYAGGWFTTAGEVDANHVARWDGAQWQLVFVCAGNGLGGGADALAVGPDSSLYAGGVFQTAGTVAADFIARWDGATSSWQPVGSGTNSSVNALAFGPDGSLYAGGSFTAAGAVAASRIARWDGATSSWHPLGSGMAGGDYPWVWALAFGPDGSLYAGGNFTRAGGVTANSIARWDGSQWRPLGSGMGGSVLALALGPDGSLYAGGSFQTAGGITANNIARWDGATSSWHPLGGGMNSQVDALAVGPDGSLYAGGNFTTAGGVTANGIARWDGVTSSWHPLGAGMNGQVDALAVGPDGSLYAGGYFTQAGRVTANSIARWDGARSSWHPLGSGMDDWVTALAVGVDGSLYVGGWFTIAGDKPSSHIAQWTGEVPRPVAWFPVVLMQR
jgi:WD40 repeat protein